MSNHKRREVLEAFGRAMPDLQDANEAFDDAAAEVLGVNRTDMRAMSVIVRGGAITPSALADAAKLSRSAMTTALDRLERAGHVRRVPDPEDRRSLRVEPTPEALRACEAIWGPMVAEGHAMMADYSTDELAAMVKMLGAAKAIQERHTERIRAMARKKKR